VDRGWEERIMRGPGLREDSKNLTLIGGSALLALLVTGGLWAGLTTVRPRHIHVEHVVAPLPIAVTMAPVSGSNRLYGRVIARSGQELTGYIRWDRNEGSWSDLLDANKVRPSGSAAVSGIRFGHIDRIDVTGSEGALFTLKSGEQVEMGARATDLGSGLRALVVDDATGGRAELAWRDLETVEFQAAPEAHLAMEGRVHGTLTTASGMEFTGYVAWDVDEIYTSDVLDGEQDGYDREVPFGAIASIHRNGSRSARVVLHDGQDLVLSGTNDVDDSNNGISVSDLTLGQVKVEWDDFDAVRFHEVEAEPGYGLFDGGRLIQGTVITESGNELVGEVRWDNDETYTWEMLNGDAGGVDFQIEFGQIAQIRKTDRGSTVVLRDGRTFELSGSNDVDGDNRGITVLMDDGSQEIEWEDFAELHLVH
jgi:hypothetical protein